MSKSLEEREAVSYVTIRSSWGVCVGRAIQEMVQKPGGGS